MPEEKEKREAETPSDSSQQDNHNNVVSTEPARRKPLDPSAWVMAASAAITALATLLLAYYTYSTLNEVKEQRKLVQNTLNEQTAQRKIMSEQLQIEKTPEVTITRPTPFNIGEMTSVHFRMSNHGGPAYDIIYRVAILGGDSLANILSGQRGIKIHDGEHRQPLLTRNIALDWDLYYTNDDWVSKFLKDKTNKEKRILAYIRAEYTEDGNVGEGKRTGKVITEAYEWDPVTNNWGILPPPKRDKLQSVVASLGRPDKKK